jgi:hypothetical protein
METLTLGTALAEILRLRVQLALTTAAASANMFDVSDVLMADPRALFIDAHGKVGGAEAAIADLAKARPYLFRQDQPGQPEQPAPAPEPDVMKMSRVEYEVARKKAIAESKRLSQ